MSLLEIWDFHISRTAYRTEFVLCSFQAENAVSIECFIYYIGLKRKEMAKFCPKLKKAIAFFFRKMPYLKIGLLYNLRNGLKLTTAYDFLFVFNIMHWPKTNRFGSNCKNSMCVIFSNFNQISILAA